MIAWSKASLPESLSISKYGLALFLINALTKKLKIPENKIIYSIDEFGNTNSASIPITIYKNLRKKSNVKILISGFGVGYSWASAIINLNRPKFTELTKYD